MSLEINLYRPKRDLSNKPGLNGIEKHLQVPAEIREDPKDPKGSIVSERIHGIYKAERIQGPFFSPCGLYF